MYVLKNLLHSISICDTLLLDIGGAYARDPICTFKGRKSWLEELQDNIRGKVSKCKYGQWKVEEKGKNEVDSTQRN